MITITAERITQSSPRCLIDRIWSGTEWKLARSGVRGLAIDYDDGRHQSVQICIDWERSYLAMSIMRFRDSASRISFFYSRPPHGVARQNGVWEAFATQDGCCLRLVRNLQLERRPAEAPASFRAREDAYRAHLQDNAAAILSAVVGMEPALA